MTKRCLRHAHPTALIIFVGALSICLGMKVAAQVNVWTQRNDNSRTGANLQETQLNTSTVNVNQFGKLFSYVVDADVYSQPLVVQSVTIPGHGVHDVVYVATMNNSVYAFDADNTQSGALPLWHVNFNNPSAGIGPVSTIDADAGGNIRSPGPVGIMGTPVVDQSTGTLYLVARTALVNGGTTYRQHLHALDITTGAEKFGGPVLITGAYLEVGTTMSGAWSHSIRFAKTSGRGSRWQTEPSTFRGPRITMSTHGTAG